MHAPAIPTSSTRALAVVRVLSECVGVVKYNYRPRFNMPGMQTNTTSLATL